LNKFKANDVSAKLELNLNPEKKYILFLGDKNYKRKNFSLALEAVRLLKNPNVELIAPYPVSHHQVVKYLNAADVFIMTAFMEGSPNVIKEAMACNCPIVSTDVGDVRWVLGATEGCYISTFDKMDVAEKLKMALQFAQQKGSTNGRERIIELGLNSERVAERIISVYKKIL
jgi:teichuronic acid biosynthesis glycosyltransferase TuaC